MVYFDYRDYLQYVYREALKVNVPHALFYTIERLYAKDPREHKHSFFVALDKVIELKNMKLMLSLLEEMERLNYKVAQNI